MTRRCSGWGAARPLWVMASCAICWACSGATPDLDRGDTAPAILESRRGTTVAIVAGVDDCVNCDLLGVFVALRALQGGVPESTMPEVIMLAVSPNLRDTLYFRQTLDRERVTARIEWIKPREVSRFLDRNKLPAMYLVEGHKIVEKWEPTPSRNAVTIPRDGLIGLVSKRPDSDGGK